MRDMDIRKCIVCKNELNKVDGYRSICKTCLLKERKIRLTANIKAILDNIYQGLLDKRIGISDQNDPEILGLKTKFDSGRRNNPERNQRYSGI